MLTASRAAALTGCSVLIGLLELQHELAGFGSAFAEQQLFLLLSTNGVA
jgi:hypothetical protein